VRAHFIVGRSRTSHDFPKFPIAAGRLGGRAWRGMELRGGDAGPVGNGHPAAARAAGGSGNVRKCPTGGDALSGPPWRGHGLRGRRVRASDINARACLEMSHFVSPRRMLSAAERGRAGGLRGRDCQR
jgi:hypothetical protein